jgi:16S rRNA processing protein RimM
MEKLVQIGQIKKPFGVKGDLRIRLEEAFEESFAQATVLFVKEKGNPVPYFIESVTDNKGWLLKLEDIDSPEQAKALSNQEIFLRAADVQHTEIKLDATLEGFLLEDIEIGKIGTILEIVEYPQQLMAIVDYDNKEVLIPLTEELLVEIRPEEQVLIMELPEGLLNL